MPAPPKEASARPRMRLAFRQMAEDIVEMAGERLRVDRADGGDLEIVSRERHGAQVNRWERVSAGRVERSPRTGRP